MKSYILSIFSLLTLQIDKFFSIANEIESAIIFIFQAVVVVITVIKIYQDIKTKHYKNLNNSIEDTKQKYPFLYAIFQYLERFKKS